MSKNNPVVHFEMPYRDGQRVAAFYKEAFGWEMAAMGEQMGDYITAETAETRDGRPTEPGTINGGFYPLEAAPEAPQPSVVIAVEEIEDDMSRVEKAGGEVLGKPVDIPGVGRYVSFLDSEGNRVSLLQPKM